MSKRHFVLFLLLLAACWNRSLGQVLYLTNVGGDDTIGTYVIDQDSGLLTELLPRVVSTGNPSGLAIHPNGKFVFVTNGGNAALGANGPSLAAFSIAASTGALKLVNTTPLQPGTGPQAVTIEPSGKFLYFINGGANNISGYSIDTATAAVTAVPGSPFAGPQGPNGAVVHPNGKFLYVSTGASAQIAAFGIGANGALSPVAGSPFAARSNIFGMTMDSAGKFLYVVERQDNAVLVYSVNATTGALTQVGSPTPAGPGVSGVAVDPAGKFLYVSNFGTGSATVYSIGATGALTQIPRGTFPAILGAISPILDPSGKFLYVLGQQANALVGYSIDPNTGSLTLLPQPFVPTGFQPQRGATVLLNPPVIPPIISDAALNAFSAATAGMPNAGVALGSLLSISGKNIGPVSPVPAPKSPSDFPLQSELGGASIQIHSGDVTTPAIMVFASTNRVIGIVPSSTPLGDATVTVTYKGRTTAPLPVTIVTTSPGIDTRNGVGTGPASGAVNNPDPTNPDFSNLTFNALNQTIKPGQLMVITATGLGPAPFDETQALSQQLDIPVDVIVGNKVVPAITTLRDFHLPGGDLVLFQVPDDAPEGCYVPIAVRAGGITSNVASISISSTGSTCSDASGLTAADIDAAQKSGQLNTGVIVVSHTDIAGLQTDDSVRGRFGRYDFNSLLQSYSAGLGDGIRRAVGNPPPGTCTVSAGAPTDPKNLFDLPEDPTFAFPLNVGPALNASGPAGSVQLSFPNYEFQSDTYVLKPGDYSVDNGAGVPGFGPFKAALTMPEMVSWTNRDSFFMVDRTQDVTVTWSGGNPDKEYVLVVGVAAGQAVTAGFICTQKVSAGQFKIPAWVLSSVPASATFGGGALPIPGGLLGIGTVPLTSVSRFNAPGLDVANFAYEQGTVTIVLYQ